MGLVHGIYIYIYPDSFISFTFYNSSFSLLLQFSSGCQRDETVAFCASE